MSSRPTGTPVPPRWTFLSNHAHVLLCLARDPDMRLREVAALVGITERAVTSVVGELEAGGYLTRERVGRRNRYLLHLGEHLRHPLESQFEVGALIELLKEHRQGAASAR